jgi:hypothetical protein
MKAASARIRRTRAVSNTKEARKSSSEAEWLMAHPKGFTGRFPHSTWRRVGTRSRTDFDKECEK